MNTHDQGDNARKSATPLRGKSIHGTRSVSVKPTEGENAKTQRRALAAMTLLELECGITPEEYEAQQAAQRARVRARWLGEAA